MSDIPDEGSNNRSKYDEHGEHDNLDDLDEYSGDDSDRLIITPLPYETRRKRRRDKEEVDEIAWQRVSRRRFLRRSTSAVGGVAATASVAGALYMLYPSLVGQFGGVIDLGPKANFPVAPPDKFGLGQAGVFYQALAKAFLVHLAAETHYLLTGSQFESLLAEESFTRDTDGSYWLALYQRCTHLGTTVAFRNDCVSFKCPSHGSHYNCDGEYLDGPAPRSMDRFPLSLQNERIVVDTSRLTRVAHPQTGDVSRLLPIPAGPCMAT